MNQMRACWVAVAAISAVFLSACGRAPLSSTSQGTPSPTVPESPSASISPSLYQPPATSAPLASESPTGQTGTCRLPFSEISEAKGGFILYPGGERQDDPSSTVALPGNTPGQIGVNPGLTYDIATGTWVPVPARWLAPGGQTYAYADFRANSIRAVTVASGSSGYVTTSGNWQLIGVRDDGVYASQPNTLGAWFIGFGSQPQQIVDHGSWDTFANGALWGTDASRTLVRHDVASSAETTWGSVLSVSSIAGFDASGEPVVYTGGAFAIHHANGTTTPVWAGTNGLVASGYAFGDSHGIWFEVDGSSGLVGAPGSGIYLWNAAGGAKLVTPEPVHVMGTCS
jgi:hypothetical protein